MSNQNWTPAHVAAARAILSDDTDAVVSYSAVKDILEASDYQPESPCAEIVKGSRGPLDEEEAHG